MSARDLERRVDERRAALDRTIDGLQHRLSPMGLMDETFGLLRSQRFNRTGDAMLTAMRRDPLPALLIAAGVGLLLYRASRPKTVARPYADRPRGHEVAVGQPYPPMDPPTTPGAATAPPIEPAADPRRGTVR